ncbi:MAG: DNA-binding protein [Gemmatimonadetes bacterium]|nr:DNA-binding protein [Gemmatimonadota bacterium]
MARPPKYTDDDITEAIDSLIDEGKKVNPSRVKHLLGGGNIKRIRAVIDQRSTSSRSTEADMPDLPPSIMEELGRYNEQSADDLRGLAARLWQSAREEVAKDLQNECAAVRGHVLSLEEELSEANRQLQGAIPEALRERGSSTSGYSQLEAQREQLKEALRNAESDLRASGKTIAILERTQRQDREEIRSLHNRVEELVAELAGIKERTRNCQHRD